MAHGYKAVHDKNVAVHLFAKFANSYTLGLFKGTNLSPQKFYVVS